MGFMDKAKQMAEQAQQKIDDAQKQFNDSQAQRAGQSQSAPAPPAGETPAAPVGGEDAASEGPGPPAAETQPAPVKEGMNDSPDPFKPINSAMTFGGILTAMVTPFDHDGSLDEDGAARLMRDLLDGGSDGLVLGGTTGEGPTLTDDEAVALWEMGVEMAGDAPVIAGTGTNDTRHTIEFTERAAAAGVDGALVVTPYYNRPSRAGVLAHYAAVAGATELPIVLYNIPQRTGLDMPNDLLAELAQLPTVVGVKQARYEDLEPVEGLDLLAGNDDLLGRVLEMGGTGGILVASHLVGAEMRRLIDEPDRRGEIEDELLPLYRALSVAPAAAAIKAALGLLGRDLGEPRLPLVPPTEDELSTIRAGLEAHGLLERV